MWYFIIFYRKIVDRICWAYAIFRSIPNLQARPDGRFNRIGLGKAYPVPPGTKHSF